MTPEIRPGDIVDITIKGARVKEICYHGDDNGPDLRFTYETKFGEAHDAVWVDAPGVTVEHVAPAEWPPQPGDLWRSGDGDLWFARRYYADFENREDLKGCNAEGWRIVLAQVNGGPYGASDENPDELVRETRLTLVHREQAEADDQQDGGQ